MAVNDEIETEVRARLWDRTIPYICQALLAAVALFVVFWVWDVRVDPVGSSNTLTVRLAAGCFYAVLYALVRFTQAGRRWIKPIYATAALTAQILLLWILLQLQGGYVLGHASLLAVVMAVIVIGPALRVSIPLVLAALALPSAVVLACIAAKLGYAGLPDEATAVNLALIHASVGVLAVVLALANSRLHRDMFLDNVQLEQLAGTDPLTAIENRRQLQLEFNRERARQRRHGRPIGVLELDIDHFKRINDAHGHGIGDEVLRQVTQRWHALVREIDVLARVGGEEFVVLLPETDAEGTHDSAERLRLETASEPVATSAGALSVTISIGATLALAEDEDLNAIIERVDGALYRAKRNGRNRCEFVEPRRRGVTVAGTAG
jgi:diguanylate cyclase (GGDEF)-like protein